MSTTTTPGAAATAPATSATSGSADERRAARILWWSLAAFVGLRTMVVVAADTPFVTPDELGAWAIAKVLVGDETMSMQGTPRYSLLSGAVLAPVQALGLDGVAAYRVALAMLSLLSVAAATLMRRSVRLLRPDRPVLAAAAWALTLLFPATSATSSFTWAEPVVTLWWALLLWGVLRSFVGRDRRAVVVTSVVAGAAVVVHGRLALVPVVWVLAMIGDVVRARRSDGRRLGAGVAVLVTAVTAAALLVLDRRVAEVVWGDGVLDVELGLEPLTGRWWTGLATATAGRLWYLTAASIGLVLLGAFALWAAMRRPGPPGLRRAAGTMGVLLVSNLAIAVVQGAGLVADLDWLGPFGGLRWDHLLYGRYIDGPLLVLCVLGIVAASEVAGRRAGTVLLVSSTVAMVGAAAVVGVRARHAELAPFIDVMMAGTSWIPLGRGELELAGWTAIAAVASLAGAVALRRSCNLFLVVLAVWFGAGAALGTLETVRTHRLTTQADLVSGIGHPTEEGLRAVVASDVGDLPAWRLGIYAQQRDLTDAGWSVEISGDDSASAAAHPDRAGLLVLSEGVAPHGGGWTEVITYRGATVWRLDASGR